MKELPVEMPFQEGGVLKRSTHIHTPDRLDKSHSALGEARLKIVKLHRIFDEHPSNV